MDIMGQNGRFSSQPLLQKLQVLIMRALSKVDWSGTKLSYAPDTVAYTRFLHSKNEMLNYYGQSDFN
jgi:hypothetical protein